MFSTSDDKKIRMTDCAEMQRVYTFKAEHACVAQMQCSKAEPLIFVFRENRVLSVYNYESRAKLRSAQLERRVEFAFRDYDRFISSGPARLDVFDVKNLAKPKLTFFQDQITESRVVRDRRERFLACQTGRGRFSIVDLFTGKLRLLAYNRMNLSDGQVTNNLKFYVHAGSNRLTVYSIPAFEQIIQFEGVFLGFSLSLIKADNSKVFLATGAQKAHFYEADLEYLHVNRRRSAATQTEQFATFELEKLADRSIGNGIYGRLQRRPQLLTGGSGANRQTWTGCSTRAIGGSWPTSSGG